MNNGKFHPCRNWSPERITPSTCPTYSSIRVVRTVSDERSVTMMHAQTRASKLSVRRQAEKVIVPLAVRIGAEVFGSSATRINCADDRLVRTWFDYSCSRATVDPLDKSLSFAGARVNGSRTLPLQMRDVLMVLAVRRRHPTVRDLDGIRHR